MDDDNHDDAADDHDDAFNDGDDGDDDVDDDDSVDDADDVDIVLPAHLELFGLLLVELATLKKQQYTMGLSIALRISKITKR